MTQLMCRNFEGKPTNMYNSLIGKLKGLPPKTQVYCGHNYTRSNLAFAQHVGMPLDLRIFSQSLCMQPSSIRNTGTHRTFPADPDNAAIKQKIAWTEERDNKGLPTIPSSIGVSPCTSAYAEAILCAEGLACLSCLALHPAGREPDQPLLAAGRPCDEEVHAEI